MEENDEITVFEGMFKHQTIKNKTKNYCSNI